VRAQVDLESEDSVHEGRLGVSDHRVVLEVNLGRFEESLAFRSLDRGQSTLAYGLGPFTEPEDHVVGIKGTGHE